MPASAISVIVPIHNGGRFLARCIESIRRQAYDPTEIIVVDDGSTDETPALVAQLGTAVRAVRQANAGPAAARNHGLRIATGELIAFLDVDDTWPEGKLVAQAGHLRDHASVQIVQGTMREEAEGRPPTAPSFNVNLGALLFRRGVFDAIGLFDETLRLGEDVDLVIRAWENGVAKASTPDVALIYHQHGDNMTNGVDSRLLFAKLFRRHLDRVRAGRVAASQPLTIAEYIGWGLA